MTPARMQSFTRALVARVLQREAELRELECRNAHLAKALGQEAVENMRLRAALSYYLATDERLARGEREAA